MMPLFLYALNRDGVLLLGSADTPGHSSEPFAPLTASARLSRRPDNFAHQLADVSLAATPRRGLQPNPRVLEPAQQLIQARNDIHAVCNDIQTSRNEVKPAKKEWQVSNEKLQSAKIHEARLRQIQSGALADGKAGKRAS
ncbi:hypothetical protein [Janthinobacterium sp. MDB2-8]|uniref:hypothetical protein n=1 Tax=Janthinobacterium sp. MDB2-8 TaxID=1259338 RepID=UPI003F2389E6